jgi:Mg2+ and Co2+ transporter CorA
MIYTDELADKYKKYWEKTKQQTDEIKAKIKAMTKEQATMRLLEVKAQTTALVDFYIELADEYTKRYNKLIFEYAQLEEKLKK